jgi:hypothetical protein
MSCRAIAAALHWREAEKCAATFFELQPYVTTSDDEQERKFCVSKIIESKINDIRNGSSLDAHQI